MNKTKVILPLAALFMLPALASCGTKEIITLFSEDDGKEIVLPSDAGSVARARITFTDKSVLSKHQISDLKWKTSDPSIVSVQQIDVSDRLTGNVFEAKFSTVGTFCVGVSCDDGFTSTNYLTFTITSAPEKKYADLSITFPDQIMFSTSYITSEGKDKSDNFYIKGTQYFKELDAGDNPQPHYMKAHEDETFSYYIGKVKKPTKKEDWITIGTDVGFDLAMNHMFGTVVCNEFLKQPYERKETDKTVEIDGKSYPVTNYTYDSLVKGGEVTYSYFNNEKTVTDPSKLMRMVLNIDVHEGGDTFLSRTFTKLTQENVTLPDVYLPE